MKAARFRFTLFAATSTCTYLLVSISISIPILISILAATIDATLTGGFALPPAFVVFGSSRITHNQQHQHRHQQPILARRTPLVLFASEQADNNLAENSNNGNGAGEISFFDEASVYVRAGSGGQGSSTYKKAKKGSNGIPDGGSGGDGGNVILRLDPSLNTLAGLGLRPPKPNNNSNNKNDGGGASKKKDTNNSNNNNSNNNNNKTSRLIRFRADDGTDGGRMYDNGRRGEDREVLVPPGTVVKMEVPREQHQQQHDNDDPAETARKNGGKQGTGEVPEIDREREVSQELDCDLVELGTISKETPQFVVARGGRGGEGTATLKGKKKGTTRRGPGGGERGTLRLTLKIVADIALVGVPNAGKVGVFVCVCVCVCIEFVCRLLFCCG
jgi:GTPase involved in cell partitioning and DNA repair